MTAADWLPELRRLATVVCVTARENYALELIEKSGCRGPDKYEAARNERHARPVPW